MHSYLTDYIIFSYSGSHLQTSMAEFIFIKLMDP